ncbi:MAG: endolytic transglycosylase MltG [Clostridia bacterium]|nr:endolytic transglycosylase MltG [Clostridia bacterium]
MDEKKSVKENSEELLSMLDRLTKDKGAEKEIPYNNGDTTAFVLDPLENAEQPKAASPVVESAEVNVDTNHYSDTVDTEDVVRPAPEGGHLTDDEGNAVDLSAPKADGDDTLSGVHFSGSEEAKAKARKAYIRAKRRNAKKKRRGSVSLSIIKAVAYTFVVCALAFFTVFGCFDFWPGIIPMANDIFAFTKSGGDVSVTLESGMTTEEVAAKLQEKGIIEEEKVFKFYVKYKFDKSVELDKDDLVGSIFHLGKEFVKTMFFGGDIDPKYEIDYLSGTHTLSAGMNYDQIILALTTTAYVREEVTVTVPEGYTADQIINLLVNSGIGTREGYIYAINEYPYKHEFVQLLNEQGWSDSRYYRLEGYLYPDTYLFYKDTGEVEVINKMLNGFSSRVWTEYYTTYKPACEKLGFTFDEMIRFASIVQAEGKSFSDFENVSQVFHNRFASTSFDKLESCATIQYAMDTDNIRNGLPVNRKPILSDEDTRYETPYNTYLYQGLPPGAICNPGLDAIEAALYPDMSDEIKKKFGITTAYYFNSDMAGNMYYAQTPYQHSVNKQKAEKVNEQIENGTYTGN